MLKRSPFFLHSFFYDNAACASSRDGKGSAESSVCIARIVRIAMVLCVFSLTEEVLSVTHKLDLELGFDYKCSAVKANISDVEKTW